MDSEVLEDSKVAAAVTPWSEVESGYLRDLHSTRLHALTRAATSPRLFAIFVALFSAAPITAHATVSSSAVELPAERTQSAKNYALPDGQHLAVIGGAPLHSAPSTGTTSLPEASGPAKAEAAASRMHPPPSAAPRDATATATGYTRPRHFAWADLLRRVFLFDILACGECGGRLRLVATIAPRYGLRPTRGHRRVRARVSRVDRAAVVWDHLGLPCRTPVPEPARPPPWLPGLAEH